MIWPAVLVLLQQLGSDDFATRERARSELGSLVRVAGLGQVEAAARGHADPEVRECCRAVARRERERRLLASVRVPPALSLDWFGTPLLDDSLFWRAVREHGIAAGRGPAAYVRSMLKNGHDPAKVQAEVDRAEASRRERTRYRRRR